MTACARCAALRGGFTDEAAGAQFDALVMCKRAER
jgi:hypothetical protein